MSFAGEFDSNVTMQRIPGQADMGQSEKTTLSGALDNNAHVEELKSTLESATSTISLPAAASDPTGANQPGSSVDMILTRDGSYVQHTAGGAVQLVSGKPWMKNHTTIDTPDAQIDLAGFSTMKASAADPTAMLLRS